MPNLVAFWLVFPYFWSLCSGGSQPHRISHCGSLRSMSRPFRCLIAQMVTLCNVRFMCLRCGLCQVQLQSPWSVVMWNPFKISGCSTFCFQLDAVDDIWYRCSCIIYLPSPSSLTQSLTETDNKLWKKTDSILKNLWENGIFRILSVHLKKYEVTLKIY